MTTAAENLLDSIEQALDRLRAMYGYLHAHERERVRKELASLAGHIARVEAHRRKSAG